MSKLNKNVEPNNSGIEIFPTPGEIELVSIQIGNSGLHWNGRALIAGATVGGILRSEAEEMVKLHGVRIIGSFTVPGQERDLSAIENQTPANLNPREWAPTCVVPGQRSAVFVNIAEMEALQNR